LTGMFCNGNSRILSTAFKRLVIPSASTRSIAREVPILIPSYQQLLKFSHRKSNNAKKIFLHEGDVSSNLYYIIEGWLNVLTESKNAEEIILAQQNHGNYSAKSGLFDLDIDD